MMNDVDVEGKLIEVEDYGRDYDKSIPQGMKRVEVEVFWRWEDCKTFDIPKDMNLSDVRDHICYNENDYFDAGNAWISEFECWRIEDQDSGEEWGL